MLSEQPDFGPNSYLRVTASFHQFVSGAGGNNLHAVHHGASGNLLVQLKNKHRPKASAHLRGEELGTNPASPSSSISSNNAWVESVYTASEFGFMTLTMTADEAIFRVVHAYEGRDLYSVTIRPREPAESGEIQ